MSLPGGRDKLPTAFTPKGLVTHNKLSILNVKRTVPVAPIRSPFSSSSRPSWGSGRQRGFRPHRSRFPSSKFPSSGSADSGLGRGGRKSGKDSTLGAWGAQGGLGEPPYLWSGDSLPDSGAPSSGFPSRRTPSSSSSRSRLSSTFRSSRARKGSLGSGGQDGDRTGSGGHSGRSGVSRHNQTQSFMSKRRGTAEAGYVVSVVPLFLSSMFDDLVLSLGLSVRMYVCLWHVCVCAFVSVSLFPSLSVYLPLCVCASLSLSLSLSLAVCLSV